MSALAVHSWARVFPTLHLLTDQAPDQSVSKRQELWECSISVEAPVTKYVPSLQASGVPALERARGFGGRGLCMSGSASSSGFWADLSQAAAPGLELHR